MKTSLALLSALFYVQACGGSTPSPSPPEGGEHHARGEHHGGGHGHHGHGELSPELRAFHEVLSPLWHADKGPDRVTKTCEKAATLHEKAEATKDAELIAATSALQTECTKEGRPQVEQKLGVVHERFHALAK
jgi:hypothetical protein